MKDIIYLNDEFINSFISQAYDGLPIQKQSETSKLNSEQGTDTDSEISAAGAKASIKILSGKYDYTTTETSALTTLESDEAKEIIAKKIYDNALNDLETLLIQKNRLKVTLDDVQFGDYVKLQTHLQLHDIRDFIEVASDNTFNAYETALNDELKDKKTHNDLIIADAKQDEKGKIRKQLRKEYEELKTEKAQEIDNTKYAFKMINIYLKLIIDYLPTPVFIKTEQTVIPLDEKFLRETVRSLGFKYNNNLLESEVIILGKVTKKTSNTNVLDDNLIKVEDMKALFGAMNEILDEFFKLFDILNVGEYIISPIAVYFEDGLI